MQSSIPPSQLLTQEDKDRIQALFTSPPPSPPKKSEYNTNVRALVCPVISKHFYNIRNSEVNPAAIRHDASFMGYRPTVSQRFPDSTAMKRRVINIGRGVSNEVDLDRYGQCNFVSFRQAVIFFDEDTKLYEFINYSMYGSYVNRMLYGSDVSDHASAPPKKFVPRILTAYTQDKKKKIRLRINPLEAKLTAMGQDALKCICIPKYYEDMSGASEGGALITHGSMLQFGCISFVFSVLDYPVVKV